MKIEIKPVDVIRWHGHTGKDSFKRALGCRAYLNSATRKYAVEFSDKKYTIPGSTKKVSEQEYLESQLGVSLDTTFTGEPHPVYDGKLGLIKLEDSTMLLNIDLPKNLLHYRILQTSSKVANSLADYEEGLFPEATHYIVDKEGEAEVKATKIEKRNRAIIESGKLSAERKVEIIMVLTGQNVASNSTDFITVELNKIIEKQTDAFLNVIERDKTEVGMEAVVIQAINKGVLVKDGPKIKYFDSVLGLDVESVAVYLAQPDNQEVLIRIKEQIV